MENLFFGTAGIPICIKGKGIISGIIEVRNLNLDALELEFVRGVNMNVETAKIVREISKKNKILLTAHAPYYINLNSDDEKKINDSINRVLQTAKILNECGGYSTVFHAGYYGKNENVYERIKQALKKIVKNLQEENNKVWIRVETTGKISQFGSIDEVVKISMEVEQVMPCIDFSHIHARTNGKFNSEEEFEYILEQVEKIGKQALKNLHIHVSGIEYSEKGERRHLNLEESDLNYEVLIKTLKKFNVKGVVISESPNIERDAILMKKIYEV